MTERTGVWLEDLTWQEAKARFEAGAVVVVPVGAAAKAHGPHLPLKTDALTARALGQGVIDRLDVVAAPVVDAIAIARGRGPVVPRILGTSTFRAMVVLGVIAAIALPFQDAR